MKIEAPFIQLEWQDNVTEKGKKQGYVNLLSDFKIRGNYIWEFQVTNHLYGAGLTDKFYAHGCDGQLEGEFDTIEDAKKACQIDFQNNIIKYFFKQ